MLYPPPTDTIVDKSSAMARVTQACDGRAGPMSEQACLYGLISTGVPTATSGQISSISSLVTAMQPSVQSI